MNFKELNSYCDNIIWTSNLLFLVLEYKFITKKKKSETTLTSILTTVIITQKCDLQGNVVSVENFPDDSSQ